MIMGDDCAADDGYDDEDDENNNNNNILFQVTAHKQYVQIEYVEGYFVGIH